MPKKKRSRKPRRPSIHPNQHSTARPSGGQGEPPFLRDVGRMLAADHPLDLLAFASSLLHVTDPRRRDRPFGPPPEGPTRDEIVTAFMGTPEIETSALLTAMAELAGDEILRRRVGREVERRGHRLPDWLERLAPITVGRAIEQRHILGDGDNVLLDVTTGNGDALTLLVYVDHNLGTLVKDAFPVGEPLAEVLPTIRRAAGDDPDLTFDALDLADARTRVEGALELWHRTIPQPETDTWPACAAMVEWAIRGLPTGGSDFPRPEWDEEDRDALARRFAASPQAEGLEADDLELLDPLLWYGCDYGPGDPLRWSAVRVELLLLDWLPRKVLDTTGTLATAPALLRRFIRFAHAESGIRDALTDETLAAVDRYEPEYQRLIRSPRPQGPAALLAAMGVLDDDGGWPDDLLDFDDDAWWRDRLEAIAGPGAAMVDDAPLPDEPLDLDVVPAEARDRVEEIAALADGCCDALLDVEHRTACRRLLVDLAVADPALVRRGKASTLASGLIWIVAKANDSFSQAPGGLAAKAVGEHLGVGHSPGQRADTMLAALDVPGRRYREVTLADPRYLVGERRRWVRGMWARQLGG